MTEENRTPEGEDNNSNPEEKTDSQSKKDPIDFILQRKNEKIAQLQRELEEAEAEKKALVPEVGDEKGDFASMMAREEQINGVLSKYPGLAGKKAEIRNLAHDPSRKGASIDEIVVSVVGLDAFMKMRSEMEAQAREDANSGYIGAGGVAGDGGNKRPNKYDKVPKFITEAKKVYDSLNL